MGFYINEEITTKLHYEDISLIGVAFGIYQEQFKDSADKEVLERMKNLVNRLGYELFNNNPENDKPNGH